MGEVEEPGFRTLRSAHLRAPISTEGATSPCQAAAAAATAAAAKANAAASAAARGGLSAGPGDYPSLGFGFPASKTPSALVWLKKGDCADRPCNLQAGFRVSGLRHFPKQVQITRACRRGATVRQVQRSSCDLAWGERCEQAPRRKWIRRELQRRHSAALRDGDALSRETSTPRLEPTN